MKSIVRSAAMLLTALVLVSCVDEPSLQGRPQSKFPYTDVADEPCDFGFSWIADGIHYRDGYLYLSLASGGLEPTYDYVRLNPKSGNVTSVCPDPVCLHDTRECPFWGSQSTLPVDENRFIIWQFAIDGAEFINRITLYDAESDKLSVLVDYGMEGGGLENEVCVGNYRFYRGQVKDADSGYRYPILRCELDSRKTLEISDSETDTLLFSLGERLYLSDGRGIYSLKFDGSDRRDELSGIPSGEIRTDGEYVYYIKDGELTRRAISDGDEMSLGIMPTNDHAFRLTENYVYYLSGEPVVIGKADLDGWQGDTVELSSPELRRCKHNGSADELIYDFSEPSDGIYHSPLEWLAVGNYVYLSAARWHDADSNGIFTDSEHTYTSAGNGSSECTLLRVDATTHELFSWEVNKSR